jgi:hypothetical protein
MDDARKPILVAIAVGVVVVLLFALGVGFGGGADPEGSGSWQERLAGIGGGGRLTADEVTLGDGCERDGVEIVVAGGCAIAVAPRSGGLSLGSPIRRAHLANTSTAVVEVLLVVEGERIKSSLRAADPDGEKDETDLTFTRDGGTFAVACRGLALSCRIALS